jgi:hypothetical protein
MLADMLKLLAGLLVVAAAYWAALQVADAAHGANQLLARLGLTQGGQGCDGAQLGAGAAPCRAAAIIHDGTNITW